MRNEGQGGWDRWRGRTDGRVGQMEGWSQTDCDSPCLQAMQTGSVPHMVYGRSSIHAYQHELLVVMWFAALTCACPCAPSDEFMAVAVTAVEAAHSHGHRKHSFVRCPGSSWQDPEDRFDCHCPHLHDCYHNLSLLVAPAITQTSLLCGRGSLCFAPHSSAPCTLQPMKPLPSSI